jgi:hypothetical protein
LKINNVINGEVITDPKKLEAELGLSMNDNIMINHDFKFEGRAAETEFAGFQLAMVMFSVKMNSITEYTLVDFIRRLAFQDACGTSPVPLPNGIHDLISLFRKMKGWIDKGWEYETDTTHMERADFVEYTEFRISQEVLKDVRKTREAVRLKLREAFPEREKELDE